MIELFLTWNGITLLMMGIDKWKAVHHKRRIPEKFLLFSAFLFGSLGTFCGTLIFHHKIHKRAFSIGVPLLLFIQLILLVRLVTFD